MPGGGNPLPPPSSHPPYTKGGRRNPTFEKLCEKTARQEYVRPSRYTSEFKSDVSNIPSSDKGSQRRDGQANLTSRLVKLEE